MTTTVLGAWQKEAKNEPERQPFAVFSSVGFGAVGLVVPIHQEAAVGSRAGRRVVHDFGEALERLAEE